MRAFIELRGSRDRRSGVWRRSICAGATGQLQKADVCVSDSAVRGAARPVDSSPNDALRPYKQQQWRQR